MLTAGFYSVAPVTSIAVSRSLSSSFCRSPQCLISALTQGGEGGHLFRLTCSVVLWGGKDAANTADVGRECLQGADHTGFAPAQGGMCFPVLHCSDSRVSAGALSKVAPAFHALPRSKQLGFLGTLQRH